MKFLKDYTIKELLSMVNYNDYFIGNEISIISGFCDDFFAQDGDLTWTDNPLILNHLLAAKYHLAIITNVNINNRFKNKDIIYCNNPLRLFEAIVSSCFTWPSDKELEIGQNSFIHDTVVIGKNVKIGSNCKISPYVFIGDNVTIGNNVQIGSFSTIGNTPYYTSWDKNRNSRTRNIYGCVIVKNDIQIGSYCSIDNGITSETIIGSKSKLGNYVEISHDVRIGNNCCICTCSAISGLVSVGNDCILWGRSGVANRIHIAPRTTLLASSILTKDVTKSGKTLCGFPAIERFKYWRDVAQKRDQSKR